MKKIIFIALISSVFLIVGCEKNKTFLENINDGTPAIGFGNPNGTPISLDIVPGVSSTVDTTIRVLVSSAKGPATATISTDNSIVDEYNTAQGTSFDYAPTDAYVIPSDVSVPSGSNEVDVKLSIDLDKLLAAGTQFALGLKLSSNGTPVTLSGNSDLVILINVRNKYDGKYLVTGTMVDAAVPTLSGFYPWNVQLVTSGANQVILYDDDVTGGIDHIIYSGTSISRYGSFGVVFNFDADNNVTSVVNYYGQPASNDRSAELDPSGINKWDPVTKTLDVKYWLNQPSVIAPHRTSFDEHFEYQGPR